MRRCTMLAAAAAAPVLASGCGSSNSGPPAETAQGRGASVPQTFQLVADPGGQLKFDKKVLKAEAGKLKLVMTNPSSLRHDIAVKGHGVDAKGKIVDKGGRSAVLVTLKPGKYEFYCSVPGHEAGGMKGTLIVGAAGGGG